ncbi:MAG: nucleotide sugar-1-phosphate transferase [Myxococcales bacterium]
MRPDVKAVILVAGIGSRLRPHTDDRPKCLVELGGEPLLGRLLRQVGAAGCSEAVLITGHMDEAIDAWLSRTPLPLPVATVYNAEYATLGNAHSLLMAQGAVRGPFVKLDGDLVMSDGLLERLVGASGSAILLDRTVELADEEMKAEVRDGRVVAMGKWLDPSTATGESIGAELIAGEDAERLFRALRRVVHEEGRGGVYYEDVYHELVQQGWELGAVDTAGLPWTEIDTPEDLARATAMLSGRGA